jgi:maltose O-acetyltransferase
MAGGDPADPQARLAVPRELLGSVGKGTEIRPPLYCDYVQVGPNVQFLTPTHPVEAEARRAK